MIIHSEITAKNRVYYQPQNFSSQSKFEAFRRQAKLCKERTHRILDIF